VETIRRYANIGGLAADLSRARQRLLKAPARPDVDETEEPSRIFSAEERLGPETVAQLVADYEAGATSLDLMASYSLGKGTVLRLLRQHGATLRQQPLTTEQIAKSIELYQQGWSLAKIGRLFGREHTVIRAVLVRAGIPRRDSHGRQRR
jgi:hypothetical protein